MVVKDHLLDVQMPLRSNLKGIFAAEIMQIGLSLQRLFNLLRSRCVALCGDLRSIRCILRLQNNGSLHQKGYNASAVIWDEKSSDGPLGVENVKDRFAQAVDRAAFLGAEIEVYVGYSVYSLLYGANDGVSSRRIAEIRFVVDRDHRNMPRTDFCDDPLCNFYVDRKSVV